MIAQEIKDLRQIGEINERQIAGRETMATQTMVGRSISQATNNHQQTARVSKAEETSSNRANLWHRMSQIYWRVSFEVEPWFQGLFSPFTAQIRRCRLLSGRDKAELEALMKKR